MRKNKIRAGNVITSLDQLAGCDWVVMDMGSGDKPLSRGWWGAWQLSLATALIKQGLLREGIRLTNGEYYDSLDDGELNTKFGDAVRAAGGLKKWKEMPVS